MMRIENVPVRLKALRAARRWSLDRTAAATGVSKAMLGQIERGESSPTIATLWKIAVGLETPFSALFQSDAVASPGGDPSTEPGRDDMDVQTVLPFTEDSRIEIFLIALKGGSRQLRAPHPDGVIEHAIVTSGELDLLFDGEWHSLKTGAAVRFRADQTHGYAAPNGDAQFYNIISYASAAMHRGPAA
jgi:transcriptional regulator with XRE-family HTH domain